MLQFDEMENNEIKISMATTIEEQSLCKKIKEKLNKNDAFWYQEEENCIYFIVDDLLYGLTTIIQESLKGEILYIYWRDYADFKIVGDTKNRTTLNKSKTKDYRFLEHNELKYIHIRMKETLS